MYILEFEGSITLCHFCSPGGTYILPHSPLHLGVLNDWGLGILSPISPNGNLLEMAGLPVPHFTMTEGRWDPMGHKLPAARVYGRMGGRLQHPGRLIPTPGRLEVCK